MLHAPRLMYGDPINSGASIGAPNAQRSHSLSLPHSQQLPPSSTPSYPPAAATLTSNRTSPFLPTSSANSNSIPASIAPATTSTTNSAMAASILYPSMPYSNGQTYMKSFTRPYERDLNYHPHDVAGTSVIIRGLDASVTENTVKIMLYFSTDVVSVELLPFQDDDTTHRSALLRMKSQEGAHEVMKTLHGKNGLTVEYVAQRGQTSGPSSSGASSSTSPTTVSTQMPRFDGTFSPLDKTSPPIPANGLSNDLNGPRPNYGYSRNIFSPQSPIGHHLSDQPRISGKSLINDATDEDDTGDILKDLTAYAEKGALAAQRRATAPNLDLATRIGSLSLNTGSNGAGAPQHGSSGMYQPRSAHPNTMSPTALNGPGSVGNYSVGNAGWGRVHAPPPANPADQNPPCNTLYVGNLPIGTSEDELKALFTRQRGYKRLCFRAKANGPMCFVEFDDVSFATKALHDLYGVQLTNSVKGGIRLSFSKNPLGIRGNQLNGQNTTGSSNGPNGLMGHSTNGFATANGPPPGLSVPPGLGANRNVGSYMTSNVPNGNTGSMNATTFAPSTQPNGASNNGPMYHGLFNSSRNNPWGPSDGYFNNAGPTTNGVTSPGSGGPNASTPFGGYRRGHF